MMLEKSMWKWNRIHLFGNTFAWMPSTIRFQCYLRKINSYKPNDTCSDLPHKTISHRPSHETSNNTIHDIPLPFRVSTMASILWEEKNNVRMYCVRFFLIWIKMFVALNCATKRNDHANRRRNQTDNEKKCSEWSKKKKIIKLEDSGVSMATVVSIQADYERDSMQAERARQKERKQKKNNDAFLSVRFIYLQNQTKR